MANKPFAIQGADLTLGGVNLQAGTTGVVIPGVTQATSYKVEEVEDTGDQTHSFVDFPVFIIDYVTYLDYDNTGSSSNRAVYLSDTLDDEGYIDGISVDDGGSYTSNESNVNDGNDLYAYIGTDSANRFTAFVPTDWLQIPFRPKMRAGEVETIGGGGGGSSITNSDNSLTIDGDGNAIFQGPEIGGVNRGLVWDYGAAVDGGTNSMVRQDQNGLSVKAWTEGDGGGPTGSGNDGFSATVNIRTNRGADEKWWRFRGDGSIAFPDGSEQTTAYTGQAPRSFLVHEYSDPEPTSVPETIYIDGMEYGGGEIVNDGAFGQNSSRVTVYADSMFAMIALNTDINAVYYNGEFGSDGSGTKSVSSGLENYRDGYYSWYNKLSGDDPCVTQIVIAKNPTTPGSVIYQNDSPNTNNDDFYVQGLAGATTVVVLNVYWDAVNGPSTESSIEVAVKAFIDGVIYDGGPTELTSLSAMKSAFYARAAGRRSAIEGWEGDLLFTNFNFFGDTFQAVKPTGGSGSGAVLELQVNPDGSDFMYDDQDVLLPGSGYQIGDTLTVSGTEFGGTSPANDVTITVNTINADGGIIDHSVTGTPPNQVWPSSYIVDGGDDQYDIGNFIGTDRTRVTARVTFTNSGDSGKDVFQTLHVITADKPITPGQWAWISGPGNSGAFINWALSYGDNNEASYLDEYTGYTSTALLDYNYQVDVDNAHVNINGAGDWSIGSSNFSTNIRGVDEIAPEPRDIAVKANGETWLFGRDGNLYLPQNGDIRDSNGNSVLGAGNSGIPLPSWLTVVADTNHLPTVNVDYGWDKDGVWTRNFTRTGNNEGTSYPIRYTDSIPADQTTEIVVEFDVSSDFMTDFGIGIFAASTTNPVWNWDGTEGNSGANRIGAQYNGPVPELHGISSGVTAEGAWGFPSAGTYVARLTIEPTDPGIATITLETLDTSGTVLNTITYTEESFFTTPYTFGFASDNDIGVVKGYFRNLAVNINNGGTTYYDALVNYTSVPTTRSDIIGDSGLSSNGSKVTIYTDAYGYQGGEETLVRVKDPASEILNTYYNEEGPFGTGTITLRNGEVRTITNAYNDGQQDGVDMTVIEWSGSVDGGSDNPRFPVTFKTGNYVDEVRDSVRIKPSEGAAQYQDQYMKVYAGGGIAPAIDSLHIHMAGAQENVELFLGTDNNYVSAKEAGTTPAGVKLHSDNDVEVVNSNLRINRKGSNWVHVYGDGNNANLHNQTYDVSWSTMAADEHGDLYVGGEANSWSEAIISKIGRDGNLIWSKYNNGDNISGWQLDGIAYHNGQVATLVQSNDNRGNDYYKLTVMDSATGDHISTTDIYDEEGDLSASSMIYHSTLGWTIVGQTYGEFGTSPSITDSNNPNNYIDWIRLPSANTVIDGQYPSNYNGWAVTGTGITGTQQFNGGVGYYTNCPVTSVSGSGANATVNVVADYNGPVYYIDQITSGGINYANGDALKIAGSVFGGVSGGTNITATPTAIVLNSSNQVEVTFAKASYPDLYNQVKWSSWAAQYNASSYNVLTIVSSGSNWVVTLDTTDDNGGTPPTITFYTAVGNDLFFTCSTDGGLGSYYDVVGTPSRAYIDINLAQLGYNGTDLRASVTKTVTSNFASGDYRIYSNGVNSWFALLDNNVDPIATKTWFKNADTITVSEPTYGSATVNIIGQYGSIPDTGYYGWALSSNIGVGDPVDSNITEVTFKGAPGTFTLTKQRSARAWVWTSSWTRYLGAIPDPNDAYPSSRGRCIAEDPNDQSLVVGGTINSPNGTGNALIWKLSKTGTTLWAKTINNDSNYVRGIAVSPLSSEIYVASNATAITKISSGGGSITGRIQPYGMWGVSESEVHVKVEDDGLEYVYVGGAGNAIWANGQGIFCLNKLTSDLQTVWGRWLGNSNDSINTDYDIDHTKFVIANGQASIAGYGYPFSENNSNGLIYTLSTQDQFDSYYNSGWSAQQNADQVWTTDTGSYTLFDLLANGVTAATATTQTQVGSNSLSWNNWTFQSRVVNLNNEQKGIKGVETIEFADGGILDHNPSDIPPSQFFDSNNTNWNYTLQLSDRGRFILNQTVPNDTYCQNLYVYVPRNDVVPFPVGTVITLINASSSSAGGQRIYVEPVDYNNQECAKIWATGGNQNSSTWSFQGIQTATLMKISTNAWLLTANDIQNED